MVPDHAAETDPKINPRHAVLGEQTEIRPGQRWFEVSSRSELLLRARCETLKETLARRRLNWRTPLDVQIRASKRSLLCPRQVRHRLLSSQCASSMATLDDERDMGYTAWKQCGRGVPDSPVNVTMDAADGCGRACVVGPLQTSGASGCDLAPTSGADCTTASGTLAEKRRPRFYARRGLKATTALSPNARSLCSTGSRKQKEQCRLGLVGQRRGSRPFLERCVVEEAPAWLEVKAPLASYWSSSLHLLSQLQPISATITFKTGIWPPAPALPFASAIPLLPPAFHPRAWRPHLLILASTPSRRRPTRDPHSTFGDHSFLSGRLEAWDVSCMALIGLAMIITSPQGVRVFMGGRSCHASCKMIDSRLLASQI